jgi:polyhydroxybutyrate depolymerase
MQHDQFVHVNGLRLHYRTHSTAARTVLTILFLLISMISVNAVDTLGPGTQTISFDFAGSRRSYIIHLPPQAAVPQPLPLVLNFHGGGGNAANEEAYTLMDTSADDHGFIVVYPNGTGTEPNVFKAQA